MSDEFYNNLSIAPEQETDAARTVASEYMAEADKKIRVDAKLVVVQRRLDNRKNDLFLRFKEEKEAGNKALTEAAIQAAISVDQIVSSLQEQVDTLKLASVRQYHRLEAVRIKADSLRMLMSSLTAERRYAGQ
jgi:hypothetical protein